MHEQAETTLTAAETTKLAAIRAYLEEHRAIYHQDALHAKLLEDGHAPHLVALAINDVFPQSAHLVDVRTTTNAHVVFWIALLLFSVINLFAVSEVLPGIPLRRAPMPTLAECQTSHAMRDHPWCESVLRRHRREWLFFGVIAGEVSLALGLTFGLRGHARKIGRAVALAMMLSAAMALLLFGICVPLRE